MLMRTLWIPVKQFLRVLSSVILLSLSWKELLLKNKLDEDAKELIEKCIVGKSLLLNMLAWASWKVKPPKATRVTAYWLVCFSVWTFWTAAGTQTTGNVVFNNYSPKWRLLAVDIYRAVKREVNNDIHR